jgi:hypothetical protein
MVTLMRLVSPILIAILIAIIIDYDCDKDCDYEGGMIAAFPYLLLCPRRLRRQRHGYDVGGGEGETAES